MNQHCTLLVSSTDAILSSYMDAIGGSTWLWIGFSFFIVFMLSLDLGLLNRKAHTVRYREAWIWTGVWVTLAMIFAYVVFRYQGSQRGIEFLTGYLIELSLSVDNLFVFILIFSFFKVPAKYQHRVLFWGVLGALGMRLTMIFVGAALLNRFHWIIYIFGAFLIYTGIKMFRQEETEIHPDENPAVRIVTRFLPITDYYEGKKFFTKVNGKRAGTLLLLVLIVVEVTDLVFAVDSIPAIFAITTNTFIVYTSNVFAILGLRSMYFLLAGVVEKFRYLRVGLAIVLTFIGAKMLLVAAGIKIDTRISLVVVAAVLLGSVGASLLFARETDQTIKVDLPPDFDLPLSEESPEPEEGSEDEVFKPITGETTDEPVETPK
ncbi:MAG TPA: TerC family protein [Pyrinomonadaceae bacterium]|nr:TerC family protein [Pyrinomonadaceae bacterium]